MMITDHRSIIPAQAGIAGRCTPRCANRPEAPAFAGEHKVEAE